MVKRGASATLQLRQAGKPRVYATNADTIVEPREEAAALFESGGYGSRRPVNGRGSASFVLHPSSRRSSWKNVICAI
jgi:hypothetical protein